MPEIEIKIGGRSFEVACQEGEQDFLISAAAMLNSEAEVLASQIGHIPESRMLLMAGLMLADRTAGVEDQLAELRQTLANKEAEIEALNAVEPTKVEVPVIPTEVTETLAKTRRSATGNRRDRPGVEGETG